MDDTERSITWRERRISYTIRRHGKSIYAHVSVLAGGKVEVLAPSELDHAAADALVTEEAPWIVQRLEGVVCWYAAAPYEFVTGESIAYLGRSYRLKVLPGETGRMKLKHRCLEVPVRKERREAVRGALVSWFRGKAEERFPGRVEAWHEVFGDPMPPVVISNQRKRLASWDRDGTMRLNWWLIQVPEWRVDWEHYLCHRDARPGVSGGRESLRLALALGRVTYASYSMPECRLWPCLQHPRSSTPFRSTNASAVSGTRSDSPKRTLQLNLASRLSRSTDGRPAARGRHHSQQKSSGRWDSE